MAEDSNMDLPSQQASQAQLFSQHGLDPSKAFVASMQLYVSINYLYLVSTVSNPSAY